MGVRIIYDGKQEIAALYCSTSDVAFGPVFYEDREDGYRSADERAEAFLRWLEITPTWWNYSKHPIDTGRRDARVLLEASLQQAYGDWIAQEHKQREKELSSEFESEA